MSQTYRTIQDEVLRRIRARIWKPGEVIPSETDLAVEFDCARATINRALRELAETGVIDRRRRAGTRVALNPVRRAMLDIPVTRLEIEAKGARYRHKLLLRDETAAPSHVVAAMNLAPASRVLHLKALHLADDRPYLYEDRWINLAAASGILAADLETISANEWLVQNVPISSGDIVLGAAGANAEDAAALDVPPGTALFVVDRTTRAQSTITKVRLAYAPGYRMVTSI